MRKNISLFVGLVALICWFSAGTVHAATNYTNWPATQEWVDLTNDLKRAYDAYNERSMAFWKSSSYNEQPTYIYPYQDYSNLAMKIDYLGRYFVDSTHADASGDFSPYYTAHPDMVFADNFWTANSLHAAAGFSQWATNAPIHLWMAVDHGIQTQVWACLNLLTHTLRGITFTSSNTANYRTASTNGPSMAQAITNFAAMWPSTASTTNVYHPLYNTVTLTTNSAQHRWDISGVRQWDYFATTGMWTGRLHKVDWYYGVWPYMSSTNVYFSDLGTGLYYTNSYRLSGPTTYSGGVTSSVAIGASVFNTAPIPIGSNTAGYVMHDYDVNTIIQYYFPTNLPPTIHPCVEEPDTDRDDVVDPGVDLNAFGNDTGVATFNDDRDQPQIIVPLASTPAWYAGLPVHAYIAQGGTTNLPFQYLTPYTTDADGPYQTLSVRTRILQSGAVKSNTRTNKLAAVIRPRGNVVIFDFPWDSAASTFSPVGYPTGINSNRTYILRDLTPTNNTDLKFNLYYESGVIHQFDGGITNVTNMAGSSSKVTSSSIPGSTINFPNTADSARYKVTLTMTSGLVSQVSYASKDLSQTITTTLASDSSKMFSGISKSGITGIDKSNASISGNTITYPWGTVTRTQTAPAGSARTVTLSSSYYDFGNLTESISFNADNHPVVYSRTVNGDSKAVTNEYDTAVGRYTNGLPKQAKIKKVTFPDGTYTDYSYDPSTGWIVTEATPVGNGSTRSTGYGYPANSGDTANITNMIERPRAVTNLYDATLIGLTLYSYSGSTQTIIQQCTNSSGSWNGAGNLVSTNVFASGGITNGLLIFAKNPAESAVLTYQVLGTSNNVFTSFGRLAASSVISTGITKTNTVNNFGVMETNMTVDADSGVTFESIISSVDPFGRLLVSTDLDGTATTNSNLSLFGPATISEADGSLMTLDYYSQGTLKSVLRGGTGITNQFEYDPLLNITKLTESGADGASRTVSTSFDALGRAITVTDLLGSTVYSYANPSYGTRCTITAPNGAVIIKDYYLDGSLKEISGSGAKADLQFEYGIEAGQFYAKEIRLVGSAATEWEKTYLNLLGQPARSRHSGASSDATMSYDSQARFAGDVDEASIVSVMNYNGKNEPADAGIDQNGDQALTAASSDRYLTRNRSVSASGVKCAYTTYPQMYSSSSFMLASSEVSLDNRRVLSIDVSRTNQASRSGYSFGGSYSVTNCQSDGTKIIQAFEKWQLKTEKNYGSDGILWETKTFNYDGLGALSSIQHSRLGTTIINRDTERRISEIILPDPTKLPVKFTYNPGTELISKVRHSDGREIRYDYYTSGLLKRKYDTGTLDVTYQYDSQGRLTNMITLRAGTAVNTQWIHDATTGYLTQKNISGLPVETYSYRDNGQLLTLTDANSVVATHNYNSAGDLASITYSDATGPLAAAVIDRLGRPVVATHAGTTNTFDYSLDGLVLTNSVSGDALPPAELTYSYNPLNYDRNGSKFVIGGAVNETTLSYDFRSVVSSISNGDVCVRYIYATNSLLCATAVTSVQGVDILTRNLTWDLANDRMSNIAFSVSGSNIANYAYSYVTNSDQISKIIDISGSHWDYQYDSRKQLISARRYFADGSEYYGMQFGATYDSIGNPTAYGRLAASSTPIPTFTPNNLNVQITRAWSNKVEVVGIAATNANITVNYQPTDRNGEWFRATLVIDNTSAAISTNIIVTAVWFDPVSSNDVIAHTTGTLYLAQTSESPIYDARASVTNDSRYRFSYDALGRLREVINVGVTPNIRETYTYFQDGRRATKKVYSGSPGSWVGTFTYSFIYDGWNLIHETITDHTLTTTSTRDYQWGLDLKGQRNGKFDHQSGGVGALVAIKAIDAGTTNIYLPLADHNGNIVHVVDAATKKIVANYLYAPFGKLVGSWGSRCDVCPFRFQSKYYDSETELYYFGYRFFNPSIAKWITRDPLAEKGGINLTAFCENDPINKFDPLGESALSWIFGQGYSGDEADAFDISLGESLIEMGSGAKQGVKDLFNGNAYNQAVDNTSIIMLRSMDARGGVWDSTAAVSQGIAFNIVNWTGIANLYESGFGYDVITQQKLKDIDRVSRALIGGGQVLLTGTGVGASYSPGVTLAGSIQATKEALRNLAQSTTRATREILKDVSKEESKLGNSYNGVPLVESQTTIAEVIKSDFSGLSFMQPPEFAPALSQLGLSQIGAFSKIGPRAFKSLGALRETLLHEELHHRFWKRGIPSPHHPIMEEYMRKVLIRYYLKKGW
ncbi:MAG: RHS repeat-associated core domain-containing protein [bacterium]